MSEQIGWQQSTLAAIARCGVASSSVQQRTATGRVERVQTLRTQGSDHSGQQVTHAADGHPRIAGSNDERRMVWRGDNRAGALQYDDCQVDDARHTLAVARTAARFGAAVAN